MQCSWRKTDDTALIVSVECRKEHEVVNVLLRTDAHHDNVDNNREMEKRHLDRALAENALIVDAGDLFCMMQGKYDRRSDLSKVRPEHKTAAYLDAVIDTAADFYAPYAKNWLNLAYGNHEASVNDRNGTDVVVRLADAIKARSGVEIPVLGYTGWMRFQYSYRSQNSKGACSRKAISLWYAHGWGGGGPVTQGLIQSGNRMPMMVQDADVMFSGHVHEAVHVEKVRTRLTAAGKVVQRTLHVVQGPSYKDEYKTGKGGWHVSTGKPPKPVGAWWMSIHFHKREETRITFERLT
jgi:hypothetical protein